MTHLENTESRSLYAVWKDEEHEVCSLTPLTNPSDSVSDEGTPSASISFAQM